MHSTLFSLALAATTTVSAGSPQLVEPATKTLRLNPDDPRAMDRVPAISRPSVQSTVKKGEELSKEDAEFLKELNQVFGEYYNRIPPRESDLEARGSDTKAKRDGAYRPIRVTGYTLGRDGEEMIVSDQTFLRRNSGQHGAGRTGRKEVRR